MREKIGDLRLLKTGKNNPEKKGNFVPKKPNPESTV
jgi:hypothetical protein